MNKEEMKIKTLAILKEQDGKGNITTSAKETAITFVVGAAGAGLGYMFGRPGLLVGIGTAFAGHYMGQSRLTGLGLGLIATGGYAFADKGLTGTTTNGIEGFKDRLKTFGANLKHNLYLDKIGKPKPKPIETTGTAGLEEVQHFKYPANELDMGSLNAIEDEIRQNSELFEKRQIAGTEQHIPETEQVTGNEYDFAGMDDDISGIEEKNY